MTDTLALRPAHELAALIGDRRLSCRELLETYLDRIARYNPSLKAIIALDEEGARQRAEAADAALQRGESWGPLQGVPITVKDCIETANLPTTCGYGRLAHYRPTQDATLVARLQAAGAIVLGKTNLARLAADMQTVSDFGRTGHPRDPAYSVGGSSGGSAVAIAAGLSALDVCAGLGGSERIPAHFCGVYGFKPTEQRVSMAGAWPAPLEGQGGWSFLYTPGVMARSVADLKLWLAVVEGPDPRSPAIPPAPVETIADPSLKDLRLALSVELGGVPVTAETRATLEQVAHRLAAAGAVVETIQPDLEMHAAWQTYGALTAAWLASRPIPTLPTVSDTLRKVLAGGPIVQGALRGTRLRAGQLAALLAQRDRITQQVDQVLAQRQGWLCPVAAMPAFPHHPVARPFQIEGQPVPYLLAGIAFTSLFTLSRHPVVVLPVGQTATGWPIGLQLVGHRWGDQALLSLAESMMQAWAPCP